MTCCYEIRLLYLQWWHHMRLDHPVTIAHRFDNGLNMYSIRFFYWYTHKYLSENMFPKKWLLPQHRININWKLLFTKYVLSRHISDRPMYWSLNVISTESNATEAGSMVRITTSEYVGKLNDDAMLASMLITSDFIWG